MTTRKLNFGVLGAAKIGIQKVVPAMQAGRHCSVVALASRDAAKGSAAARQLNIAKVCGSYEELLADSSVEAVYIPLPNNLHVPWAIKALQAGKHVLCEKPIGLTAAQAEELVAVAQKHPQLKIMEAFMYRFHPQWQMAKKLTTEGKIGQLRTVHSVFSYSNVDPKNIRNNAEMGGGGLMDIGCYCVSLSRFLFDTEPVRISAAADYDPNFHTDRLTAGLLEFPNGIATFTCSTQLAAYQRVNIFGTEGRIEIEIPFNAPPDQPCRLWHQQGKETKEIKFDICNQYTLMADAFAAAVLEDRAVPVPITDAVANMRVIEAIAASARKGASLPRGSGSLGDPR
jgi:predicted dehydrogenase